MFNNLTKQKEDNRSHEQVMKDIDSKLARLNSLPMTFTRGLVSGLAATIGATIVAGILFAFLSRAINEIEDLPVIDVIIDRTNIREVVPDQNQTDNE